MPMNQVVMNSLLMHLKEYELLLCTDALNERSAMYSTNFLQEEDDKSLSLGRPMRTQEEESDEEDNKEDMIPTKLGDVQEPPTSPTKDDSNSKTQNSLVFYGTCYYDESDEDTPIIDFDVPNNAFDDNEEFAFDMIYDNALDDGPILLDNPPCLENVNSLWED